MKVALAADHAGYELKEIVKEFIEEEMEDECEDFGTFSDASVDYPDFAQQVAKKVSKGEIDRGILICGTGIGMSIVANKFSEVRAALCHDVFSAEATRRHNDSNILTMGSRVIGEELALKIVCTWLSTGFDGGRHQRRLDKIALFKGKECQL